MNFSGMLLGKAFPILFQGISDFFPMLRDIPGSHMPSEVVSGVPLGGRQEHLWIPPALVRMAGDPADSATMIPAQMWGGFGEKRFTG